ncbi:hypothetical protein EV175_004024 [Coemansia sp. RSA 1933]|nr:hypothetical protein EV175_004024 [Coemansia sp. RSA 1933]
MAPFHQKTVRPSSPEENEIPAASKRQCTDNDEAVPAQIPRKGGGRNRPAPLVLMFEPVYATNRQQEETKAEAEIAGGLRKDDIRPETRSLRLLLVDAATNDYVEPELHDCRVRCVFESIETRGIIYRAKRMGGKLRHYLQADRARYIQVFRHRMQALWETGAYNNSDMQSIRGHLLMLEQSDDAAALLLLPTPDPLSLKEAGDLVSPIITAAASTSRSIVDNGVLRNRTTERDIELALIRLKHRFSLPLDFVGSTEFRDFCTAAFIAQKDRTIDRPLSITADAYLHAVDRSAAERRLSAVRDQISNINYNGGGYSVILCSYQHAIGVFIRCSHQSSGASLFELVALADADIADTAASKVNDCLVRLHYAIVEGMAESVTTGDSVSPHLVSIVTAGTALESHLAMADIRNHISSPTIIRTGCAVQMLRAIASSLLGAKLVYSDDTAIEEARSSVIGCSLSLIEVVRTITANEAAQSLWATTHKQQQEDDAVLVLPDSTMATASYLRLFQQMVSVDYEFLLQLKNCCVDNPSSHHSFDTMLDHSRAPMFLALVQMLAILNRCIALAMERHFTMADLAVLLARLEATLESLAFASHNGASGGDAPTDEMQTVARCVLSEFHAAVVAELGNQGEDGNLVLCMLLAHSLSLYPRHPYVRTSFVEPLSSLQLMDTVNWILRSGTDISNDQLSIPKLYARWAEFHAQIDSIRSNSNHLNELPASFSMRKVMELVGLFSNDKRMLLDPMVSLSAVLNSVPVTAASALDVVSPTELTELTDTTMLKEIEISAADKLKRADDIRATSGSTAISVSQYQTQMLTCVAEYNDTAHDDQQGVIAVWDIGPDEDTPMPPDHAADGFAHTDSNSNSNSNSSGSMTLLLRYFDPAKLQSLVSF